MEGSFESDMSAPTSAVSQRSGEVRQGGTSVSADSEIDDIAAQPCLKRILCATTVPRPRIDHPKQIGLWISVLSEFLGSFVFLLLNTITYYRIITKESDATSHALAAFFSGLAYVTAHLLSKPWSKGQINPAITVGMIVCRMVSPLAGVLYHVAQVAGALAGGHLATCLVDTSVAPLKLPERVTEGQTFYGLTALGTILVLCYLLLHDSRSGLGPGNASFILWAVVAVTAFSSMELSGGILNPAQLLIGGVYGVQAIGPQLSGPMCGGVLAALLRLVFLLNKYSLTDLLDIYIGRKRYNALNPTRWLRDGEERR